jgi:outer membrane protein assembly factor BamA
LNGERCEWALMQNDLLRLGGERSVRGVDENSIGVFPSQLYDQSLVPATVDGVLASAGTRPGLFGAVANFEVRFSLIPQLFVGELKPAVFADAGVSTDDFDFDFDDADAVLNDRRYAFSVGAGLRYVLPVGPLAVDVAYSPFAEAGGDVPLRVYVLLGYIF